MRARGRVCILSSRNQESICCHIGKYEIKHEYGTHPKKYS